MIKNIIMIKTSLIVLFTLLLATCQAGALSYFAIYNVSRIQITPGSEADFSVSIREIGADGGYAMPVFRNVPDGLNVSYSGPLRYILPTAIRSYNCNITAGNIPTGNYSFDTGAYGQNSPYNWKTTYAEVTAPPMPLNVSKNPPESESRPQNYAANTPQNITPAQSSPAPETKPSPGPGALLAIAAVVAAGKMKWKR